MPKSQASSEERASTLQETGDYQHLETKHGGRNSPEWQQQAAGNKGDAPGAQEQEPSSRNGSIGAQSLNKGQLDQEASRGTVQASGRGHAGPDSMEMLRPQASALGVQGQGLLGDFPRSRPLPASSLPLFLGHQQEATKVHPPPSHCTPFSRFSPAGSSAPPQGFEGLVHRPGWQYAPSLPPLAAARPDAAAFLSHVRLAEPQPGSPQYFHRLVPVTRVIQGNREQRGAVPGQEEYSTEVGTRGHAAEARISKAPEKGSGNWSQSLESVRRRPPSGFDLERPPEEDNEGVIAKHPEGKGSPGHEETGEENESGGPKPTAVGSDGANNPPEGGRARSLEEAGEGQKEDTSDVGVGSDVMPGSLGVQGSGSKARKGMESPEGSQSGGDSAGEHGTAGRAGVFQGDRLRGGTQAGEKEQGLGQQMADREAEEEEGRQSDGERQEGEGPGRAAERQSDAESPKRKARDFGFAEQPVHQTRRRALEHGFHLGGAQPEEPQPELTVQLEELLKGRLLGTDSPDGVHGPTKRGPWQCKVCGATFVHPQALGGHMSSHRHQNLSAPVRLDSVQPTLVSQFGGQPQGSRQTLSEVEAALQALDAVNVKVSGAGRQYYSPSQVRNIGTGRTHADTPTQQGFLQYRPGPGWERLPGPGVGFETRTGSDNRQTGVPRKPSGPDLSPTPPRVYLPGQEGAPGSWYELEPVDPEHPERIPPVSLTEIPTVVAERIREALIDYSHPPRDPGHQAPPLHMRGSDFSTLGEPLTQREQASILEQLQGQQQGGRRLWRP